MFELLSIEHGSQFVLEATVKKSSEQVISERFHWPAMKLLGDKYLGLLGDTNLWCVICRYGKGKLGAKKSQHSPSNTYLLIPLGKEYNKYAFQ